MTDNRQRKCFGEGDNLFIQVLMGPVWRGMIRGQQEISTTEHYCVILSPEYYYILISCVPVLHCQLSYSAHVVGSGILALKHHFLVQLNHFKWPLALCSSKKFTHRHRARHWAQIV